MYSISFDIDWAADEIIEHSIKPILDSGLNATIFATHKSNFLKKLYEEFPSQIEIGIHPNFTPLLNGENINWKKNIEVLKDYYPSAIGVRAHGHVVSSNILTHYINCGMLYESGIYVDNMPLNSPLPYEGNFFRFGHFFQDDAHLIRKRELKLETINLKAKGIKIFDFHPIHIFLNSPTIEFYEEAKIHFNNFDKLKSKSFEGIGIKNIYLDLVEFLSKSKKKVLKMKDLIK